MENRFGFKDLITSLLLVALLVSVWLAMAQYNHHFTVLKSIEEKLDAQRAALQELSATLQRGLTMAAPANPNSTATTPATTTNNNTSTSTNNAHATTTPNGAQSTGPFTGTASIDASDPFGRVRAPRLRDDFAFGDWFVDSFAQVVGKLTPLIATDAYQSAIEGYVLEPLITRDPDTLEWKPWIASAWQVSEDGLTISFDLRKDVKFSDNTPLTSADVLYTYNLTMNPEINAPRLRPYYENIESVETPDPHRVVFRLKRPYFMSLSITGGMTIMPKHFYEKISAVEFNESTGLLMGSGPYKLAVDPHRWQPGSGRIELIRNEHYWGPRPSFDRLVWREITDEKASEVSFRNSDIDVYVVRPEQYAKFKDDKDLLAKANLHEYESPTFGYRYVGWNQRLNDKPTPFADQRVRMAMTLLTNRQEMADQLMSGLATVATGPFHHLSPQSDPNIKPWPFDTARAKALLQEAGYMDRDGDGILEGPDGKPFRFKLIYPAGSVNYQQMATYLKDAYARAGIVLDADPTEWNTMIQRINDRNFEAITLGWGGVVESDPKQIFHSEMIAEGGDNYVSYNNPQIDALIDKARMTVDEEARKELWRQVHRILHEDQPYTFLFNSRAVVFIDKRVQNVLITRTGMNDRTEMFVPLKLQRWNR